MFQSWNIAPMLKNNNRSYTSQNQSSVTTLKHFVYMWKMNVTAELSLPSMIPTWDIEHHNINIEKSLAVCKIIQAWQY